MPDEIDWARLDRYFSGDASPGDAIMIEEWAAQNPARARELEAARRLWATAAVEHLRFDAEAAKARVHAKMASRVVNMPVIQRRRASMWRRHLAIAAAVAAILVGGGVWRAMQPAIPALAGVVAGPEYVTGRGERHEFRLPDGTRVVLGPESRLSVSSEYGRVTREVALEEGQGYFDVAHDEQRPFAVHTNGAVARDLGTKFDVRAYEAEGRVRVAVTEGEVALNAQTLRRGDVGERTRDGNVTVRAVPDVERYHSWVDGRLQFDDMPLDEALRELTRWYDVNFELADSTLASMPLSVTLGDRPDPETLQLLALTVGTDVERRGETVIIGRSRQ